MQERGARHPVCPAARPRPRGFPQEKVPPPTPRLSGPGRVASNECQQHPLHLSCPPKSESVRGFFLCPPQALIYPLTVASKSTTTARHNAANKILKNMCEHSNTLVQQAMMVRRGAVRGFADPPPSRRLQGDSSSQRCSCLQDGPF